jgi:hypothetical protein
MRRQSGLAWLARVGYTARGIVFVVLGCFTVLAALGARGRPLDTSDALRELLQQPFGAMLLSLLAAGLICFSVWRAVQSTLDPDGCGDDVKGLSRRMVYACAALFYLAFATVIISMIFWDGGGDSERAVHDWTAFALARPSGRWIVGIAGSIVFASGVGIGVGGLRAEIRQYLELKKKPRLIVSALGGFGSVTRAAVFMIVGGFLIFAAIDSNSHEATGLAGALMVIQRQPYGAILLGVTALGFLSFGLFGFAEAAFRRIDAGYVAEQPAWLRA